MIIWFTSQIFHKWPNKYTAFLYYWLPIFLFTFMYEEIKPLLQLVTNKWYDDLFSIADIRIFGLNFSLWVEQYDYLLLNELFRVGYGSYYFIILFGSYIHYFQGELSEYISMLSKVTLAFIVSYILFIFLPTQGPRFYQSNLFQTNMDGLLFSYFQQKIMEYASFKGGAFPSSHVAVALIILTSFYKNHFCLFFVFLPFMVLLIIGTVWGRYHYAIDVIAGIILAVLIELGFRLWKIYPKH
jgi:membrane-associated phospholipid phosphatase